MRGPAVLPAAAGPARAPQPAGAVRPAGARRGHRDRRALAGPPRPGGVRRRGRAPDPRRLVDEHRAAVVAGARHRREADAAGAVPPADRAPLPRPATTSRRWCSPSWSSRSPSCSASTPSRSTRATAARTELVQARAAPGRPGCRSPARSAAPRRHRHRSPAPSPTTDVPRAVTSTSVASGGSENVKPRAATTSRRCLATCLPAWSRGHHRDRARALGAGQHELLLADRRDHRRRADRLARHGMAQVAVDEAAHGRGHRRRRGDEQADRIVQGVLGQQLRRATPG